MQSEEYIANRPRAVTAGVAPRNRDRDYGSDLDLGAELDDLVGRDTEKLGRPRRETGEDDIEMLAPSGHSRPRCRFDVGAPDEEGDLAGIEIEPRDFRAQQLPRHVRGLGEPEMRVDLPKTVAEFARLDPIRTQRPAERCRW